jgi:hypothetical protein
VRENKALGPYVDGLSQLAVVSYQVRLFFVLPDGCRVFETLSDVYLYLTVRCSGIFPSASVSILPPCSLSHIVKSNAIIVPADLIHVICVEVQETMNPFEIVIYFMPFI